jgi:hypothetical protein
VPRLFAGTPWDRPPTRDRCGRLETECSCLPPVPEAKRIPPHQQTARLMTEPRAKGKLVTVIAGLDPEANDLNELAAPSSVQSSFVSSVDRTDPRPFASCDDRHARYPETTPACPPSAR